MRKFFSILGAVLISTTVVFVVAKIAYPKFQLQVDRYKTVVIGMTPKEASAALGQPLGPEPDKREISCYNIYPPGKNLSVGFMVENGVIARIDVYSPEVAATGGIRIGDSEKKVQSIFKGKVLEEMHPYFGPGGKNLIIESKPGYAFVFETDENKIIRFMRAGRIPPVLDIEACQ